MPTPEKGHIRHKEASREQLQQCYWLVALAAGPTPRQVNQTHWVAELARSSHSSNIAQTEHQDRQCILEQSGHGAAAVRVAPNQQHQHMCDHTKAEYVLEQSGHVTAAVRVAPNQ